MYACMHVRQSGLESVHKLWSRVVNRFKLLSVPNGSSIAVVVVVVVVAVVAAVIVTAVAVAVVAAVIVTAVAEVVVV